MWICIQKTPRDHPLWCRRPQPGAGRGSPAVGQEGSYVTQEGECASGGAGPRLARGEVPGTLGWHGDPGFVCACTELGRVLSRLTAPRPQRDLAEAHARWAGPCPAGERLFVGGTFPVLGGERSGGSKSPPGRPGGRTGRGGREDPSRIHLPGCRPPAAPLPLS